jgi:hypothetical protein
MTPLACFEPVVGVEEVAPEFVCATELTEADGSDPPDEPEHPLNATISARITPTGLMRFTMAS